MRRILLDMVMANKRTELQLNYDFTGTTLGIVDIAKDLSALSRRLYRQGRRYFVNRITMQQLGVSQQTASFIGIRTIPDTWVTANAWVKAKGLWDEMNAHVFEQSPELKSRYHDFKVYFNGNHFDGTYATQNATSYFGAAGNDDLDQGEWDYSQMVLPQYSVDAATGLPLAADTFNLHMLGGDVESGSPATIDSGGVIQMYEDTRPRPSADQPDVPTEASASWGTLIREFGSSQDELVDIIEDENDNPPYDRTEYVGSDTSVKDGWHKVNLATTSSLVTDNAPGFYVPCGLMFVGATVTNNVLLSIHLASGEYQGVHAPEMKQ